MTRDISWKTHEVVMIVADITADVVENVAGKLVLNRRINDHNHGCQPISQPV